MIQLEENFVEKRPVHIYRRMQIVQQNALKFYSTQENRK